MAMRWALTSQGGVLFEDVDDFLCCYCSATGHTHLFDAFPAEILKLLDAGPRSSEELGRAIAAQAGDDDAADWLANVDSVLAELRGLSLVEQEPA